MAVTHPSGVCPQIIRTRVLRYAAAARAENVAELPQAFRDDQSEALRVAFATVECPC
jgi:hypothetical protein